MSINYMQVASCDQCGNELGGNSWEIKQYDDLCPKCYRSKDKIMLMLCKRCGNELFNDLIKDDKNKCL